MTIPCQDCGLAYEVPHYYCCLGCRHWSNAPFRDCPKCGRPRRANVFSPTVEELRTYEAAPPELERLKRRERELLELVERQRAELSGRSDPDHLFCVCGREMFRRGAVVDCECGMPEFRDELVQLRAIARDLAAADVDHEARLEGLCVFCKANDAVYPHASNCPWRRARELTR